MNIAVQRHPKELLYRTICLVIGGIVWAAVIIPTKGFILLPLIAVGILLWITEKFFQAKLFGNSVLITDKQYPKLHKIVMEESKKLLGSQPPPLSFVVNTDGVMNAIAIKFISKKYVLLFDSLIDVLWDSRNNDALRTIVAHEIAHHAAGHTHFFINLILMPAFFIPYLGPAYSRSRELTADRTAAYSVQNPEASMQALIAFASGSKELLSQVSVDEFIEQESKVPFLFGFLLEILATHPRITLRVLALKRNNIRAKPKANAIRAVKKRPPAGAAKAASKTAKPPAKPAARKATTAKPKK